MDVKYIEISPALASVWLESSKGNPRWRNGKIVDKNRVSKIASDIKNGDWNPGNNSIAFDSSGALVDGHHRLSAIVKANIPVWSIVVTGIEGNGLKHIDENRSRTVSQRLGIDKQAVAVANCRNNAVRGFYRSDALTSEEVLSFVERHPLIYDAIQISCFGSNHPIGKKAGVQDGILAALECGVSVNTVQNFAKCVNSGFISGDHESAAIVLRNTLLRVQFRARSDSVSIDFSTQSAISDFVNGVSRKKSYQSNKGIFSDRVPF